MTATYTHASQGSSTILVRHMIDASNVYSGYMWNKLAMQCILEAKFSFLGQNIPLKCAIQTIDPNCYKKKKKKTIDPKIIISLFIVYETLIQGARSHHNIGPSKPNNLNHHNWGISLASIIHTQSSTSQNVM
jgi:hypothetical protein